MQTGWEFGHVGMIVKNIGKTAEFYKKLGFVAEEPTKDVSINKGDVWVNGKPSTTKIGLRILNLHRGTLILELVEPIEGDFMLMHSLNTKGEGVDHFAFSVADLETEKAKLVEKGFPVIFGGGDFAFFDTRTTGTLTIELRASSQEGPGNAPV